MPEYRFQIEELNPTVAAARSDAHEEASVVTEVRRILMVGMHLTKTRGGISTLAAGILRSKFVEVNKVRYIASQAEDHGTARKFLLAVTSAIQFVLTCMIWRPSLVYVHIGSNASLYRESTFILLGKLFRKPVIAHFHAGDIDNYYPSQPKVGRKFIKKALGKCDRIIAVSHESSKQLRRLDHRFKVAVIPNAIDTTIFHERDKFTVAASDDPIRILFVGAIGKLKGEKDLITALAQLHNEIPTVRVSILGYGAEDLGKEFADKGIAHMVEHLGPVSMADRIEFYERSDIFVLPTYAEAMPMSVIESMAAGLPTITTRVGGIPELIDHEIEGLLFNPGDISTLADHINQLAKDRTKISEMGIRARKRIDEQMNFPKYVEKLCVEITGVCGTTK